MCKTYKDTQFRQLIQLAHRRRVLAQTESSYVSLANEEGELLYVNEAYGRRDGCDPVELVGRNLLDLVPPEEHDAVRGQIAAVLRTDQLTESVNRVVDGELASVWVPWRLGRR